MSLGVGVAFATDNSKPNENLNRKFHNLLKGQASSSSKPGFLARPPRGRRRSKPRKYAVSTPASIQAKTTASLASAAFAAVSPVRTHRSCIKPNISNGLYIYRLTLRFSTLRPLKTAPATIIDWRGCERNEPRHSQAASSPPRTRA